MAVPGVEPRFLNPCGVPSGIWISRCSRPKLVGEKLKTQFRVEMFNILNNTNLQALLIPIFDGNGKLTSNTKGPNSPTRQIKRGLDFCSKFSLQPRIDPHGNAGRARGDR